MGRKIDDNIEMAQGDITDYYYWELVMPTMIINQLNENEKPKGMRIDPTNPPIELGVPNEIRLIPQKKGLSELTIAIPPGASPVYFCLRGNKVDTGVPGIAAYAIGYKIGNKRTLRMVEPVTGSLRDCTDTIPTIKK